MFYLAGLIESWGRGVEMMFSACKSFGAPAPEYVIMPGDIMIHFSVTGGREFVGRESCVENAEEGVGVTEKITDKVTKNVTEK